MRKPRDFQSTFVRSSFVIPTEVEESLKVSVVEKRRQTTVRDVSRSTRSARSRQALNMAAAPPANGSNGTLPLDMTESGRNEEVVYR